MTMFKTVKGWRVLRISVGGGGAGNSPRSAKTTFISPGGMIMFPPLDFLLYLLKVKLIWGPLYLIYLLNKPFLSCFWGCRFFSLGGGTRFTSSRGQEIFFPLWVRHWWEGCICIKPVFKVVMNMTMFDWERTVSVLNLKTAMIPGLETLRSQPGPSKHRS